MDFRNYSRFHWDLLQHFWILFKVSQRFIGFSRILQQGSCFINNGSFYELLWVPMGLVVAFLDSIKGFIGNCVMDFQGLPISCSSECFTFKNITTRFTHQTLWILGMTLGFIFKGIALWTWMSTVHSFIFRKFKYNYSEKAS